jgi:hypothetical protein
MKSSWLVSKVVRRLLGFSREKLVAEAGDNWEPSGTGKSAVGSRY